MNIYITTTGLTPSVIFSDLGYRVITHPTINYNIGSEFTYDELFSSLDFNNQLDYGYFTASINGSLISDSQSFQPLSMVEADHGSLSGLGDDDHVQYLLTTGARALTGDLNLGGNSITNVNLVDGVDVSLHASRHLPNGADPLTTGTPSSVGTVNQQGVSNALARQDHVHALGTNVVADDNITSHASTKITITNKNQLNGSIAYVDQANTFGTFSQSFKSGNFSVFNPTNTFSYGFTASEITGNRNVLLPLLTSDDTFVFQAFSQSMTNKTLLSTNNNVIDATRLQTFTVSTVTPQLDQALLWNGSSWTPGTVSTSGGATGATGPTGAPGVGSASTDRQAFTSSTAITTTSATYVDLTGFTLTTKNFGQTGSYLINFSGYCSNSAAGASSYFILNINGVQMLTSERRDTQQAGPQAVLQYNTIAISTLRGLTAGSIVKVQFRNSGTGTVTFYGGELNINGVPVATVI
jgi:hypothetical protein